MAKDRRSAAPRELPRQIDFGLEDRLLPLEAVKQIAGLGKTMIYRKMREGTFPQSCKPGGASARWSEREVQAWRAEVLAARQA